ncbi:benzoate/H(+) symporter BenE family transporter [Acinetobacter qingfengensis]|uniref:Uncharacterized protein n=1 Tax=Acinetobacter qingfengensis TaxID=1262585 RepID=A0A1E7R341_9GAMM|nr:benzoate/H(+) symporter BenE family transporter [Acinetobacter qingfengensis]KAA8733773.1 benzoate/H(+) symporter BenE family transporter [Acinetobacter qingfengensis]OEY93716.1 hypothetical protein BJI46_04535 [Acinetobacter qingfengensis]
MSISKDISFSAIVAGFIAVVIAYASSAVIIFHAAQTGGLSTAQTASWLASASLGCGLVTFFLSLKLKMPIITAWSTPGAALLVTALPLYSLSEAIGAYIISAILVIVFGVTGLFQKVMRKIPMSIIAAMLAGILLQFCLQAFAQIQLQGALVGVMCIGYFISKILLPRYAIVCTLLIGSALVFFRHDLAWSSIDWSMTIPVLTMPTWSVSAIFGIALPLFIVAMTSQNASGLAVMQTSGYQAPESKLITHTGIMSLLTAPFGSHGVTLSSITAAICTSSDCHPNAEKRYIAGLSCAFFYVLFAVFAQSMVELFALVPKAFIVAIAGLALFSACSHALKSALAEENNLDAAMLTFMVTASNLTLWGVGSAFWGLCAGVLLYLAMQQLQKK